MCIREIPYGNAASHLLQLFIGKEPDVLCPAPWQRISTLCVQQVQSSQNSLGTAMHMDQLHRSGRAVGHIPQAWLCTGITVNVFCSFGGIVSYSQPGLELLLLD